MEIAELSIKELRTGIAKKRFSAKEAVLAFLKRIDQLEDDLNAFITICAKEALREAKKLDRSARRGKLCGIPIALKDNIVTRDLRTTAGSAILKEFIPPYSAAVVEKLLAEGAIILGKTNMDEFAMGASTENSFFGPTRNPRDLSRVPGGSSGGSAAAVAARLAPIALGSDTGGSVRQPAAFCGVVGLRPTYGAVSRYGLISMASSLDQIGPLARTVEDAQFIFEIIRGYDPYDATTIERPKFKQKELKMLKIGVPKEYFGEGLDKNVRERVETAIGFLEETGAGVDPVSLPHTEYGIPTYYLIVPSEVSSNLGRYDGIRFGLSVKDKDLLSLYFRSRGEGFGVEVKRRIALGTFALSSGYFDQYYLKAARVRTLIVRDFERAFKKVDLLITPTVPTTAFKLGEKEEPLSMYLADVFTIPASLAGLPALNVPVGFVNGLPVGIQLIGPRFSETLLFEVGKVIEKLAMRHAGEEMRK